MKKQCENSTHQTKPLEVECNECKDVGSLLRREWVEDEDDGKLKRYDYWRPCSCQERKYLQNRFKKALIPEEFKSARLDNYEQHTEAQRVLFQATQEYLKSFTDIIENKRKENSLGFIAVLGESRIRSMSVSDKYRAKEDHNNFGLGKTHLQMAAAKFILNRIRVRDEFAPGQLSEFDRGCHVLCVSDVSFMDELTQSKMMQDGGETYRRLLEGAVNADVLIWDDLGKAKWTEAREGIYYQIFNERNRNNRPVLFSSNEDRGTLSDKIGFAASSRLLGMCGERLYAVEGADYRQKRGVS